MWEQTDSLWPGTCAVRNLLKTCMASKVLLELPFENDSDQEWVFANPGEVVPGPH